MKALIRIPTKQYGFIEIESEVNSAEDAIVAHNDILKLYAGGEGLDIKEWNAWLDRYLTDGTGDTDSYMRMSLPQQNIIQEIKKSMKRIKVK